jgi:hypothetical protein
MMGIVHNDDVAAYYLKEFGIAVVPPFVGFVVLDEASIRGAVIINDVADCNCEMSAVGDMCWTPGVIRYLARYVFDKLKVRRVTSRTRLSNSKAKRALLAMGFQYEGRLRDWYENEDAVVFGLLARNQKLIRKPK